MPRQPWLGKVISLCFPRQFQTSIEPFQHYVCFNVEVVGGTSDKDILGRTVEVQLPIETAEDVMTRMAKIVATQKDSRVAKIMSADFLELGKQLDDHYRVNPSHDVTCGCSGAIEQDFRSKMEKMYRDGSPSDRRARIVYVNVILGAIKSITRGVV